MNMHVHVPVHHHQHTWGYEDAQPWELGWCMYMYAYMGVCMVVLGAAPSLIYECTRAPELHM